MAFCSLDKGSVAFDVTPIENLFIQEFLPNAPGDYVKVYLCALMQSRFPETAEPSLDRFAATLGMEPRTVLDAMRYWQRQGLVRPQENNAACYEMVNVRSALYEGRETARESALFSYAELNAKLDQVTAGRAFTPQEYDVIYDWVEVLGLTEEAVVELVRHGYLQSGKKFSVTKLSAVARDWQKKGILTGEKARNYLDGLELLQSPVREVLKEIGIMNRNPTMDEHRMWLKWHEEWGFTLGAVKAACAAMTKIQHPNIKYLDRVLKTLHDKETHSVEAVISEQETRDARKERVQPFAFELGLRGGVTNEHLEYYDRWKELGLEDDAITVACRACAVRGGASFKDVNDLLSSCVRRGLRTAQDIESDLQLETELARIFAAAGVRRAPAEKDKEELARWKTILPMEVILVGAEIAREGEKPFSMLNAIIARWQGEGVKTVEDAQASREKVRETFVRRQARGAQKSSVVHVDGNESFKRDDLEGLAEEL